jgi:hypothetical protein
MFYKQSAPARNGEPGTRYSAYDHADTMAEAVVAYKRCRNARTFILTENSPDRARYKCVACGALLSEPSPDGKIESAYVDYSPRSKTARPKHYSCGWATLLGAICTSYSLAEAGAKLAAADGAGVVIAR